MPKSFETGIPGAIPTNRAESFGATQHYGVQPEIRDVHRTTTAADKVSEPVVLPPISVTEQRSAADRTRTDARIYIGESDTPTTMNVGMVSWNNKDKTKNVLTTHPDLTQDILLRGPMALDIQEDAEIVVIHVPDGADPDTQESEYATKIEVNATEGLFTLHKQCEAGVEPGTPAVKSQVVPIAEGSAGSAIIPTVDSVQMSSMDTFAYEEVPQLRTAISELGFAQSADKQARTYPTPQGYVRRMDKLRETDTDSGIYYPRVRLIPEGHIDPLTYVTSYAEEEHPFGAKDFFYYGHDVASPHDVALHIHGEEVMNVLGSYARVEKAKTEDPKFMEENPTHFDDVAETIDQTTDNLGGQPLYRDGTYDDSPTYIKLFTNIVPVLRDAGQLDNLKIVKWMREQGVTVDTDKITGRTIADALMDHARLKFPQQQKELVHA